MLLFIIHKTISVSVDSTIFFCSLLTLMIINDNANYVLQQKLRTENNKQAKANKTCTKCITHKSQIDQLRSQTAKVSR